MVFFVWLELAPKVSGGRDLGFVLIGYTFVTVGGMAWYGKERWRDPVRSSASGSGCWDALRRAGLEGPPDEGRVQRRGFGSALSRDLGRPRCWSSSRSRSARSSGTASRRRSPTTTSSARRHFVTQSVLLVTFLAVLAGLVLLVARRVGLAAMGAGLVPVAIGYLIAHYLTYLLIEGQRIVVALSDPLQQGWDLLGTAHWEPREDWLASSVVWTMQVVAVVIGHVVGAWLGHSAVRRERAEGQAVSQWPLAALMIGLTVLALWSLGQNLVFVSEATPVMLPEAGPGS